jgi:hypothetical protein
LWVTIDVTAENDAPEITSSGALGTAAVAVAENGSAVVQVTASDPDGTPVFAIVGGADAARFTIDAADGTLRFVSAPDHEAPADADGDNVYHVLVQASDGIAAADQAIAVTVTDVAGVTRVGGKKGDVLDGSGEADAVLAATTGSRAARATTSWPAAKGRTPSSSATGSKPT